MAESRVWMIGRMLVPQQTKAHHNMVKAMWSHTQGMVLPTLHYVGSGSGGGGSIAGSCGGGSPILVNAPDE